MVLSRLVEGRGYHLRIHAPRHVRYLFGTLVYQQHNHIHLGVVSSNGVGDVLEQHGLTRLRLRHNQSALPFANGGKEVDDTDGKRVVLACAETELLGREECGQVFEGDTILG